MTTDELRHNYADAFIALVMDGAEGSALDVHHRDAIILALQDAIEFFSAAEYGTEIS
tara:strand:- start:3554 stop:3724 length:171 start_codon:yes stop_codon:yes gene_type:complete